MSRTGGRCVLTYGSLMNQDELAELFPDASCIPVKLSNHRRTFRKKSFSRAEGPNGECGVLTISRDDSDWCNGILVYPVSEADFEAYDAREGGYDLEPVDAALVEPYPGYELPDSFDEIITAYAIEEYDDIRAIPEYGTFCMESAIDWGDVFARDFLLTTF